jgi:hypothetical protein
MVGSHTNTMIRSFMVSLDCIAYLINSSSNDYVDWSIIVHRYFPWYGLSLWNDAIAKHQNKNCWNPVDWLICLTRGQNCQHVPLVNYTGAAAVT